MSEHFQAVVDHVMSDDDSELGKVKAELAYALFSLEREIGIAHGVQAQNDALVKALTDIIEANKDFRDGMPQSWDGDPLQDACDAAAKLLPDPVGSTREGS